MKRRPTFLLLPTDQNRSPTGIPPNFTLQSYTPFGWSRQLAKINASIAFNGERPEARTGHYLLGNGYRAYNPVLMRFHSPDNVSPFGDGGINCYAYSNDPINYTDPSGHSPKRILNKNSKLKTPLNMEMLFGYEIEEMTMLDTFLKSDPRALKLIEMPNGLRLDEIAMRKALDIPSNISKLAAMNLPHRLKDVMSLSKNSIHNTLARIMTRKRGGAQEATEILKDAYKSALPFPTSPSYNTTDQFFNHQFYKFSLETNTFRFRQLFHNPQSIALYATQSHAQPKLEALSRLIRERP